MADFVLTIVVRFVGGAVIGCILSFVCGWHDILSSAAKGQLPLGFLLLGGTIGGLIGVITTPKRHWPWRRKW